MTALQEVKPSETDNGFDVFDPALHASAGWLGPREFLE